MPSCYQCFIVYPTSTQFEYKFVFMLQDQLSMHMPAGNNNFKNSLHFPIKHFTVHQNTHFYFKSIDN